MTTRPVNAPHAWRPLHCWPLLAVVVAAGIVWAPTSARAQQGSMLLTIDLPDSPSAGAQLFSRKACGRCHSIGSSRERIGPDLGQVLVTESAFDVAGELWNHSPIMRARMAELGIARPTISADEMAELLTFLAAYRYRSAQIGEEGDNRRGRQVFVDKGCAGCHEEGGLAWGRLGPNLQKYRGEASAIYLTQAMWNHSAPMGAAIRRQGMDFPQLSGPEVSDLVAYLRAGAGGVTERPYFEVGRPAQGRDVFERKQCIRCHAIAGAGGTRGPDLAIGRRMDSVADVAATMWNHSQRMTREFEQAGLSLVAFSGQEMADLIAYLYFVNASHVRGLPARGSNVFAEKCSVCHSVGAGERVGPDLSTIPSLEAPIDIMAAMWNHASGMQAELDARNLEWPVLEAGEAADVIAFILSSR